MTCNSMDPCLQFKVTIVLPLTKVSWRNALLEKEEEIPLQCTVLLRLGRPEKPADALHIVFRYPMPIENSLLLVRVNYVVC